MNSQDYATKYEQVKHNVLLEGDIALLKEISSDIANFKSADSYEDLIDIESRLVANQFKMSGLVSRLNSQAEIMRKEWDKSVYQKTKEIGGTKTSAEAQARAELQNEREELEIFTGIAEEYRNKFYSIKDVQLAITHRLKKFNPNE